MPLSPIEITNSLQCSRNLIYHQDKVKLYHYLPLQNKTKATPLLINFALVNRPSILDLQPDRSFIRALLQAGLEVYLIDWGYPSLAEKDLRLEDYILKYLHQNVEFVKQHSEQEKVNLMGVCQGGTFALCYAALFPKNIKTLITMVTAVDFHTPDNQLTQLVKNLDINAIVQAQGNIPGWMLNQVFFSLKTPASYLLKYQKAYENVNDTEKMSNFLRMEQWLYDTPDLAGAAFVQYVTQFYQQNLLIKKQFSLNDRLVDLDNINMPVLNIYAAKDDIIPFSASECLKDYLPHATYDAYVFDGGHIGIYVSAKAQKEIPPKIIEWLTQQ